MLKEILKALIVFAIAYVLVELLLPTVIPAVATIFYWVISFAGVLIVHFVAKSQGFPIFDE